MSTHWMTYVKHSYDVIIEAEHRSNIVLEHEIEAFLVHLFARYIDKPNINNEPVAISLMESLSKVGEARKQHLSKVAEQCILIDGLELNRRRWPSNSYYCDMGKLALEYRAWSERPPDLFYERVAKEFNNITTILHKVKV